MKFCGGHDGLGPGICLKGGLKMSEERMAKAFFAKHPELRAAKHRSPAFLWAICRFDDGGDSEIGHTAILI